jgi:hypothetical protein
MARVFNGTNESINLGDIALDGVTSAYFSTWAYFDALTDFSMLFTKRTDDSNQFEILLGGVFFGNNSGELVILCCNGSANARGYSVDIAFSTSTWYHIFVAYNGGGGTDADKLKLFINGTEHTLTYSGTLPATLPTIANSAFLGARSGTDFELTGKQAEFAIWTGGLPGGLTAQAAASLLSRAYSPSFLRKNGLHHYQLIGRSSPEVDRWGGNAGTLTGTAASVHPRIIMPRRPALGKMIFTAPVAPDTDTSGSAFLYMSPF